MNIANQFGNNVAQERCETNHEFAGIKNVNELRKAVQGFKSKTNRTEESNTNKENEPYQANQSKAMNFSQKGFICSPPAKQGATMEHIKFDSQASALYMTV